MKGSLGFGLALVAAAMLLRGEASLAQSGSTSGGGSSGNIGRDTSPLNPENSLELVRPVDRSEESAFREFERAAPHHTARKIALGESFLKKYPLSSYRALVYSGLTSAYLEANQLQKMEEAGEMAIALNPKDVQVLATLAETLPRMITAMTPESEKQLDKAERYAKQAIEQIPLLTKPENVSDQEFAEAKDHTLAIARSGLGLVDFRRGNLEGTIQELNQAIRLDPRADAANYYVLGVANYNARHYEDAAKAFTACAEFPGNLQATCTGSVDKAKSMITGKQAVPR